MVKIRYIIFTLFMIIHIISINNVLAEEINPISEHSPIKETFDKKIIIWDFDDIRITDAYSSRGAKFITMTENVTKHGGYVGWGFIPGTNEIGAYPSPQNLTYKKENVDRMNVLTSDEHIFMFYHDWDHAWYQEGHESLWLQNLSVQRQTMNHVVWTFYNNFGYNLSSFLGGGSLANYNTTVVLAERDILLLFGGSDVTKVAEGCRYLHLPDDELVEMVYLEGTEGIDSWKENFTRLYEKYPIIRIGSHPFDFNETSLTEWAEFTEWVYTNHDLVNMNYSDAYNYKHDLKSIQLDKHNDEIYTLSFKDAFNPLKITWSEPGDWIVEYVHNQTKYENLNVSSVSESILLEPGSEYTIRLASSSINTNDDTHKNTPGFEFIFTVCALILILFFKRRKIANN